MQGLKEGTTYKVQIYSRKDIRLPVGDTQFTHHVEDRSIPNKSTDNVEIFGIRLTGEQLLGIFFSRAYNTSVFSLLLNKLFTFFLVGVYIGVGISVILIILCIIIICAYKRKFDKHYRQVANGPHFKPSNEKHEMKVLTKNTNGYRVSNAVFFLFFFCFSIACSTFQVGNRFAGSC